MENLYQSESRRDMLKRRASRCVCKYCGSKLVLKCIIFSDVADARVEIYCEHCNRLEFGVEPEVYRCARYFVTELEFDCYDGLDNNERKQQMNVAKVCELLAWGCKNMGLLDQEGFRVSVKMATGEAGFLVLPSEAIHLSEGGAYDGNSD